MAKKTTAPTADEIRARAQANIEAEAAAAQAAAEEAPKESPDKLKFETAEPDELTFEATGVSQFDSVIEFQTPGETFTGTFHGTKEFEGFTDDSGNKKPMLVFHEYQTDRICIANPNWQLYEFFVNKNTRTSIQWEKAIFRITFAGYDQMKQGKKVARFEIKVAYRA